MRQTSVALPFTQLARHLTFPWRASYYVFAGVSLGGYLLMSTSNGFSGFPLDDAWIHQTYARNLAQYGEWSFIPGEPSAGSTAPLWSAILSVGYFLGLHPLIWNFILGCVLLGSLGLIASTGLGYLSFRSAKRLSLAGVFFIFEWHLVWAAGSGMETLLFALIALFILVRLNSPDFMNDPYTLEEAGLSGLWRRFRWAIIGMLIGLSAWVRPDGITLLGPAGFVLWMKATDRNHKIRQSIQLTAGFLLLFLPYLLFNNHAAGALWPNTFYAKQAEYAIYRQIPVIRRALTEASLPLVGAGSVLLPGFLLYLNQCIKVKNWPRLAIGLWVCGYLGLYALRLPAVYQHGRYVIPVMPAYFLAGLAGFFQFWITTSNKTFSRILKKSALVSGGILLAVFWLLGGRAFANDISIIESEMVTTANWVAGNTPHDAIIAAHDIGALGYYGNRQILDLAGLVSPEVIPMIRDENQLSDFIGQSGAAFLMTFPAWYPELTDQGRLVFQTHGTAPSLGGENMAVYRWLGP